MTAEQREQLQAATSLPIGQEQYWWRDDREDQARTGASEPWAEASRRYPRIIVKADAGLGKTWLLRHEARELSRAQHAMLDQQSLALDEVELPVFVPLKKLSIALRENRHEEVRTVLLREARAELTRGRLPKAPRRGPSSIGG